MKLIVYKVLRADADMKILCNFCDLPLKGCGNLIVANSSVNDRAVEAPKDPMHMQGALYGLTEAGSLDELWQLLLPAQ